MGKFWRSLYVCMYMNFMKIATLTNITFDCSINNLSHTIFISPGFNRIKFWVVMLYSDFGWLTLFLDILHFNKRLLTVTPLRTLRSLLGQQTIIWKKLIRYMNDCCFDKELQRMWELFGLTFKIWQDVAIILYCQKGRNLVQACLWASSFCH